MKYLILILFVFFGTVNAEDIITLKSGRKVEGTAVIKGNEVHLIGKYGTIIFNASDVKVEKSDVAKSAIADVSEKNDLKVDVAKPMVLVPSQITSRSGRVLIGNIYQQGEDVFLVDLGGTVKIDPFVLLKKETLGGNKVRGDIISGERCNVVLKSGRAFSGIVEEVDDVLYVSSVLGTVRVEKKNIDHIENSGVELNLLEEQEKLSENPLNPVKPKSNTNESSHEQEQPNTIEVSKTKKTDKPVEMTISEMVEINKKANEAIMKTSQKETKKIKTVYEMR